MRNRTITISLFVIVLGLFLFIFIVKEYAFPSGQPITGHLDSIIEYAQQKNWPKAAAEAKALDHEWDEKQHILYLNYAETDIFLFDDSLSRIQGGIQSEDVDETVSQSLSALKLWKNFIKIIPNP